MIIEGLLPFASPSRLKQTYAEIAKIPDKILRIVGLLSVIAGILLLFLTWLNRRSHAPNQAILGAAWWD